MKVEKRTKKCSRWWPNWRAGPIASPMTCGRPLRTMHNFSNFLLEEYSDRLDAIGLNYLERIDAATQRLDHYLRDLLHYGKMGREICRLREVDTTTLIARNLGDVPEPAAAPSVTSK